MALWRFTGGFSSLKASSGIFFFLVFNTAYLLVALEASYTMMDYEFKYKLIAISISVISIALLFKKKITNWLIKVFKLKD
ncbi:hypothetical protein [Ekhidna sp. To15]|uniref:hypothetical protein n=1 Tax=Ekhidna sp. To15 TaxID=3395267 RepID=UPI003F525561